MCYILIVKQTGEHSDLIERQIRRVLKEKAAINNDGFFFRNGTDVIRTLSEPVAKKSIEESVLNNLMAHFRMASVGEVSEQNVHGWTFGEWSMFHNGGISTYNTNFTGTKQEFADSYLFFQDLYLSLKGRNEHKDKVVARAIKNLLEKVMFWGRAALYNSRTDRLYLFGDFHVYSFGGKYMALSSSEVNFDQKIERRSHGIPITYPSDIAMGHHVIDGIGVISNFSQQDWTYRSLISPMPKKNWTNYNKDTFKLDKEGWDYDNGCWKRKLHEPQNTPGLPTIYLPPKPPTATLPDVTYATPEQELMMENMRRRESDDDLELDLKNYNSEPYSAEKLKQLYEDKDFVGWNEDGDEMYADAGGIHDIMGHCCYTHSCRKLDDLDGIVLKEDCMPIEEKSALSQIGFKV